MVYNDPMNENTTTQIRTIRLADTIECYARVGEHVESGWDLTCETCDEAIATGAEYVETSIDPDFAYEGVHYHAGCFSQLLAGWGITL